MYTATYGSRIDEWQKDISEPTFIDATSLCVQKVTWGPTVGEVLVWGTFESQEDE